MQNDMDDRTAADHPTITEDRNRRSGPSANSLAIVDLSYNWRTPVGVHSSLEALLGAPLYQVVGIRSTGHPALTLLRDFQRSHLVFVFRVNVSASREQ